MAKSEYDKAEQVIALAKAGLIDHRTAAEMMGLDYRAELGALQLENDLECAREEGRELALIVAHHVSTIRSKFAVRDPSGKIISMDELAFSDYWSAILANLRKVLSGVLMGDFFGGLFVTREFDARCANVDFIHDGVTLHVPTKAGLAPIGTRMCMAGVPLSGYAVAKRRGHVFMLEKRAAEQFAQGPWYLLGDAEMSKWLG